MFFFRSCEFIKLEYIFFFFLRIVFQLTVKNYLTIFVKINVKHEFSD